MKKDNKEIPAGETQFVAPKHWAQWAALAIAIASAMITICQNC